MDESVASESVEALTGHEVPAPVRESVWSREEAVATKRASLRMYLGAAPGVGKTYAMLSEGRRRAARGTDVVIGFVQTYGRPLTEELLEGLEAVPPRRPAYRGTTFNELDAEGLIQRARTSRFSPTLHRRSGP